MASVTSVPRSTAKSSFAPRVRVKLKRRSARDVPPHPTGVWRCSAACRSSDNDSGRFGLKVIKLCNGGAYALEERGRLALVHVGRAGRPPSQILYLKVYSGPRFAAAGRLWGSVGLSGNVPRIATAVRTSACCSAWRAEVAKAASARAYESRIRSPRKELAPTNHELEVLGRN